MKALRIVLQLVILGAGGITLAALISQPAPDFTTIVIFGGFVALLLALTLALKEHTEKRLVPGHKLSFKPMGIVMILLGAFGIFYGASFLIDQQSLPNDSGTCRAVCGLILLISEIFGETVAKFFAFGTWSSIGLFLCFVGYKVKGVKAT
ncbi:hypothetical protein [Atopomonas hussainii]|uniref:hypothetical protein n=1 Tax=Atopomonas hussainii TaxID=1429083 RepID=UPI000900048C|nr:hypothetical protein [Atopomonas hussainii]